MNELVVPSDHSEGVTPVVVPPRTTLVPLNSKVLIVTPWQKQVSPVTSFCVSQLSDRRRTATALHFGDAFVAHSRNSCADTFLASSFEWMLTIDDDMIVPFGEEQWFRHFTGWNFDSKFMRLNALDRLMSHGKTLVGALYFGRHKGGPPVYNEGSANKSEAEYAARGPYDLIKPTRWVGTGCMIIHRRVFEDIEKKFPRLARGPQGKGGNWFTSTEATLLRDVDHIRTQCQGKPLTGQTAYDVVNGLEGAVSKAAFENPLGSGEDVSFCLRAMASGHQPFVDMGLRCGHIGHWVF